MPYGATGMPSPTCSEDRRHKRVQVSASGASMQSRAAKSPSAWTGCRQRGAGPEVRPQAAPDPLGVTQEYHPIDEPVTADVSQLSLGKALTEPAVEIIRQHHVT